MDYLFTKLFTCDFINIDVNDETQWEELKSDIRQAFTNCDELTNYDINNLEFLFDNGEKFYFTYPNSTSIILYNGFDETWHLQYNFSSKIVFFFARHAIYITRCRPRNVFRFRRINRGNR